MEDFDTLTWHYDTSPTTSSGTKSRIPYPKSPTSSPTSMMTAAIDLSRKSAQLPGVFASKLEQPDDKPEALPVRERKGKEESHCAGCCLYVGIAQVRAGAIIKDGGNCSGDVISDLHVEIGDVFQHMTTDAHFKADAKNAEHAGRILVKKIKSALAGLGFDENNVDKIGFVPKCYLAKVPSLLNETSGAATLNELSPNISHKMVPGNEAHKTNEAFPHMVSKSETGIDLKQRVEDAPISHQFPIPSNRPTGVKLSTAEMLADFSPNEVKPNSIAASSQNGRPFFNPKRPQFKQANPSPIVHTPVDPLPNSSHLLNNPNSHLLLPNTSVIAQKNNLMVPPFTGGLQLDSNAAGGGGFLGALNPFAFPNSFPLILHLLKNMPQLQQAAFTAAVMHRYQLMQMDSTASQSESSRVMPSPPARWASDATESFLARDNSPRLPDCEAHFNFDIPANVFSSGILSKDSLCPVSKAEPLFPSSFSSVSSTASTVPSSKSFFSGGAAKLCNMSSFTSSTIPQSSQQTHNPGQYHHPSIHPLKKHGRGRPPYRSVELIVGMGVFEHGRFKKLTVRNKFGIGGKEAINVRCTAVAKEIEAAAIHQHKLVNKLITNVDFTLVFPDGTPVKYLPGTSEPFVLKKYKEMRNDSWIRLRLFLCPTKHLIQANASSSISTPAPHLDVTQNERIPSSTFLNIPATP